MKKVFYLFGLLTLIMLAACNDSDEPQNKQTVNMTINSRAIDGENVVFSQGSAKVELDYTNMLIKFTAGYKDANGQSRSMTTPDMKMSLKSNTVYTFTNAASSSYSGIDLLTGYLDMATGMMWYAFDDGSCHVITTTHLLYAYATTRVTNPDNGNNFSHEKSAYLFEMDPTGESCTLYISNFIPNIAGSVQANEIRYTDLTVTPTATGYNVTASEAESNYNGFYTITDLNFALTSDCQIIRGTFKCDDLDFTVSGDLFPNI